MIAPHTEAVTRRPLFVIGAVAALLVIGVIVSYAAGIGPLARTGAPRSVVFVAISRSTDEGDAREIEAIDLDAGTRQLFDVGGRITALALSPDRRSLYVGFADGKVALLDAITGARFGSADLGGPAVISLVPTSDGRTLFAVAITNVSTQVVPIALDTKKVGETLTLTTTGGPAVLRGGSLIVPLASARGGEVAFVDAAKRVVTSRLMLPRGSLVAPVAFAISDSLTGVVLFDSGGPGALGMRVYAVTDPTHWRDVRLDAPLPQPRSSFAPGLQAAAAADGTIHTCAIQGSAGRRYVITPADLKATAAGPECGPLAGGDSVVMARRDPAQLLVLGERTGKTLRTLPLAGIPARLVH